MGSGVSSRKFDELGAVEIAAAAAASGQTDAIATAVVENAIDGRTLSGLAAGDEPLAALGGVLECIGIDDVEDRNSLAQELIDHIEQEKLLQAMEEEASASAAAIEEEGGGTDDVNMVAVEDSWEQRLRKEGILGISWNGKEDGDAAANADLALPRSLWYEPGDEVIVDGLPRGVVVRQIANGTFGTVYELERHGGRREAMTCVRLRGLTSDRRARIQVKMAREIALAVTVGPHTNLLLAATQVCDGKKASQSRMGTGTSNFTHSRGGGLGTGAFSSSSSRPGFGTAMGNVFNAMAETGWRTGRNMPSSLPAASNAPPPPSARHGLRADGHGRQAALTPAPFPAFTPEPVPVPATIVFSDFFHGEDLDVLMNSSPPVAVVGSGPLYSGAVPVGWSVWNLGMIDTGETCTPSADLYTRVSCTVTSLALQLARGLSHMHEKGVLHLDLRPEHIVVTVDGVLKITHYTNGSRSSKSCGARKVGDNTERGGNEEEGGEEDDEFDDTLHARVVQPLNRLDPTYRSPEIAGLLSAVDHVVDPAEKARLAAAEVMTPQTSDMWSFALLALQMMCGGKKLWGMAGASQDAVKKYDCPFRGEFALSALHQRLRQETGAACWSVTEACEWMQRRLLGRCAANIARHRVDGANLLSLSRANAEALGIAAEDARRLVEAVGDSLEKYPMPPVLATVLERCFAPDVDDRPGSMREIVLILETGDRVEVEPEFADEAVAADMLGTASAWMLPEGVENDDGEDAAIDRHNESNAEQPLSAGRSIPMAEDLPQEPLFVRSPQSAKNATPQPSISDGGFGPPSLSPSVPLRDYQEGAAGFGLSVLSSADASTASLYGSLSVITESESQQAVPPPPTGPPQGEVGADMASWSATNFLPFEAQSEPAALDVEKTRDMLCTIGTILKTHGQFRDAISAFDEALHQERPQAVKAPGRRRSHSLTAHSPTSPGYMFSGLFDGSMYLPRSQGGASSTGLGSRGGSRGTSRGTSRGASRGGGGGGGGAGTSSPAGGQEDGLFATARSAGSPSRGRQYFSAKPWKPPTPGSRGSSRERRGGRRSLRPGGGVKQDPSVSLANALREDGQTDEAIQTYEQVLKLRPDHATAQYNMGIALVDAGKLGRAIAVFHKALRFRGPHQLNTMLQLGRALEEVGDTAEAIQVLKQGLRSCPSHPDLLSSLTTSFQSRERELREDGRHDAADECKREAAQSLLLSMGAALKNKSRALAQDGQAEAADRCRFQANASVAIHKDLTSPPTKPTPSQKTLTFAAESNGTSWQPDIRNNNVGGLLWR